MSQSPDPDSILIAQIRSGDSSSWAELVDRFEGRLLAYVDSRLSNRSASEDIVQETFIGFLNSLPNYDSSRSLENYLFSICAFKLTDHLRREGRRPTLQMGASEDSSGGWHLTGPGRAASSIARSTERRKLEEEALISALREQVDRWKEKGDWTKLKCIELLIVEGMPNKEVAERLDITEQQVANFKFDFLARTKMLLKRQDLSEEVFPELHE
ncbi:MAG: RNA polymerase sigma factor [Planctomycetota bacterium]